MQAISLTAAFKFQIHAPPVVSVSCVSADDGDRIAGLCHSIGVAISVSTKPVIFVNNGRTGVARLDRERLSNNGAWADGKSRTIVLHTASMNETDT